MNEQEKLLSWHYDVFTVTWQQVVDLAAVTGNVVVLFPDRRTFIVSDDHLLGILTHQENNENGWMEAITWMKSFYTDDPKGGRP